MGAQRQSVYRSRNFVKLWMSQVVSKAGTNLTEIALAVFALRVSGYNTLAFAGVLVMAQLPSVVLGWAAGGVVDRWDKRRMLVTADVLRAVLMASVPFVNQLGWTYAVVFLNESLNLLYRPSIRALLPETIPPSEIMPANAALAGGTSAVDIPAYLLGAVLVLQIGLGPTFLTDASSFLIAGISLWSLRLPLSATAPRQAQPNATTGFWTDIREGLTYYRQHALVSRLLWVTMAASLGLFGLNVLWPSVVHFLLHLPEGDLGWMLAGQGFGLWALSAYIERYPPDQQYYRWMIGAGFFMAGALSVVLMFSRNLGMDIGLSVLAGVANGLALLPIRAWIQILVPKQFRGRVYAVRGVGLGFAGLLSVLFAGIAARVWNVDVALWYLGGVLAAAAVVAWTGLKTDANTVTDAMAPPA